VNADRLFNQDEWDRRDLATGLLLGLSFRLMYI